MVTGATGFVGGHLVDQLRAHGDGVVALVRSPAKAGRLAELGVTLVRGDLHDHAAMRTAVEGVDVIYHVAALTGAVDEAEFLAANRDGTARLLAAARAAGHAPRFVLVSSMAAGGPARRDAPRVADGDDQPVTMYGRSKLASERVLRGEPLPWTILRPPSVYGPRDRDNFLTVFRAARIGMAPVFGDGAMQLSLIHVEDLASAIIAAGTSDGVIGHTYYVNHPEVVTSAEMVRAIGRTVGRDVRLLPLPEWVARTALTATGAWAAFWRQRTILRADKANEFFQEAWTGDPSAFIAATGWAPQYDLARGLPQTAAWYRDTGLL
jgi:dihydroflavonol-4-reductase